MGPACTFRFACSHLSGLGPGCPVSCSWSRGHTCVSEPVQPCGVSLVCLVPGSLHCPACTPWWGAGGQGPPGCRGALWPVGRKGFPGQTRAPSVGPTPGPAPGPLVGGSVRGRKEPLLGLAPSSAVSGGRVLRATCTLRPGRLPLWLDDPWHFVPHFWPKPLPSSRRALPGDPLAAACRSQGL